MSLRNSNRAAGCGGTLRAIDKPLVATLRSYPYTVTLTVCLEGAVWHASDLSFHGTLEAASRHAYGTLMDALAALSWMPWQAPKAPSRHA